MKIARIFTGDINNQKGKFNNVIDRIKFLDKEEIIESDNYIIQYKYTWSFKFFKKIKNKQAHEKYSKVDNLTLINLWVKLSLFEYLLSYRFKLKDIACKHQLNRYVERFENYDLIASHDLLSTHLATIVKKRYNKPFVITWHGSDINKYPYRNKKIFNTIKFFLENADMNFFVSKNLMLASDKISQTKNKTHLYTGPSALFYQQPKDEIEKIKKELNISTKYVVGFIGNMKPIKNIRSLPGIFNKIRDKINNVSFLIVGDGSLLIDLKRQVDFLQIQNVFFMGSILPKEVPKLMNAMDVLLLPSLNEGLPRVTLEAQVCGVNVVGSNAGGITEVVDEMNCFELNENFEEKMAKRVIELLKTKTLPKELSEEFCWVKTIKKEVYTYRSILNTKN